MIDGRRAKRAPAALGTDPPAKGAAGVNPDNVAPGCSCEQHNPAPFLEEWEGELPEMAPPELEEPPGCVGVGDVTADAPECGGHWGPPPSNRWSALRF
jgi:hypothetical protein